MKHRDYNRQCPQLGTAEIRHARSSEPLEGGTASHNLEDANTQRHTEDTRRLRQTREVAAQFFLPHVCLECATAPAPTAKGLVLRAPLPSNIIGKCPCLFRRLDAYLVRRIIQQALEIWQRDPRTSREFSSDHPPIGSMFHPGRRRSAEYNSGFANHGSGATTTFWPPPPSQADHQLNELFDKI